MQFFSARFHICLLWRWVPQTPSPPSTFYNNHQSLHHHHHKHPHHHHQHPHQDTNITTSTTANSAVEPARRSVKASPPQFSASYYINVTDGRRRRDASSRKLSPSVVLTAPLPTAVTRRCHSTNSHTGTSCEHPETGWARQEMDLARKCSDLCCVCDLDWPKSVRIV